jgi:hypothetical protein
VPDLVEFGEPLAEQMRRIVREVDDEVVRHTVEVINEESVERMVNQLVFVCHALTGMKTTLLTELGLWRRSVMAWRRARRGARGLIICTDVVV